MAKEIERKFLVCSNEFKKLADPVYIHQGFLNDDKHRTVRIRIIEDQAYLTVKGISEGPSRREFEYQISVHEAAELLEHLCLKPTIMKYRYFIHVGKLTWEVDEFLEENIGLVVAEVELETEDHKFNKPDWIGKEVTHDARYFNANLIKNPYCNWREK